MQSGPESASSADGDVERGGRLHGSDLLLGGEAALDAGANLRVRLAALVADGLLEGAPLALLAIPEQKRGHNPISILSTSPSLSDAKLFRSDRANWITLM